MRAAPTKFLFENDFTRGGSGKPSIGLDEHAARLKEAEAAAFVRGREQGAREAKAEADRNWAALIQGIAASIAALDRQLEAVATKIETEAVEVAVAVAKKLAPQLMAQEPVVEIAALATGCFRNLVKCPHLVVRVNDALHESARAKLDEIVRRCSPDTRLVVLAESEIAVGDCRIEWADGGIDRDAAAIAAAIDEAVSRYVTGRRNLGTPAAGQSTVGGNQ
ncbi:MAG: flagellar assembly protein FliH [Hyphomicrobiales bacterium]|nr:flagellar assembly protein FliH [Hyphomicrobiales bacterium]